MWKCQRMRRMDTQDTACALPLIFPHRVAGGPQSVRRTRRRRRLLSHHIRQKVQSSGERRSSARPSSKGNGLNRSKQDLCHPSQSESLVAARGRWPMPASRLVGRGTKWPSGTGLAESTPAFGGRSVVWLCFGAVDPSSFRQVGRGNSLHVGLTTGSSGQGLLHAPRSEEYSDTKTTGDHSLSSTREAGDPDCARSASTGS